MMVFISVMLILALLIVGSVVLVNVYNRNLVRGWTYKAEPSGHGYRLSVTGPDGVNWGNTSWHTRKRPVKLDAEGRRGYRTEHFWHINSPKQIKGIVLDCAKKQRERDRLDAREQVEGKF